MKGSPYTVQQGDTLWDLAARHLGDPTRWQEIFELNNDPAVFARTKTKIVDPDLIFVGQTIYLPSTQRTPGPRTGTARKPPSARPLPKAAAGKKRANPKVRTIPFKYSLDDLPEIKVVSPTHIAIVKLKGSITLQGTEPVEFLTLTKQGFELQAKQVADHAFGKLVTGTEVGFNPATNDITIECGITSHSNIPGALSTKAAAGVSTKTGLPVLKGSISAKEIKGKVDRHFYVAANLGIDIEISPRPPSAKPKPVQVPVPVPVPSARPVTQHKPGWDYLIGGALIAGAGIIVVATIAEDIITLGAGIADDVPSFAAAAAMFTSGVVMFKTVHGGSPVKLEGHGVAPDQL